MNETSKMNNFIPNVTEEDNNVIDLTMVLSDDIKDYNVGVFHKNDFIDALDAKEFIDSNFISFKPQKKQYSSKFFQEQKGSKRGARKKTFVTRYGKKKSPKAKNDENSSKSTMMQSIMFDFIRYGVNVGKI